MKYTKEKAISEIKRRSREIKKDREKKINKGLMALSCLLVMVIVGDIGLLTGPGSDSGAMTAYGSFLLTPEYSLYVIVAVAGFLLGIGATLLVKYFREKRDK
jgi:hypothetical protein